MPELTGYWSLLYQIPIGLLGLSFLVFIHELGHFLVAKWAGVKVNTFSIGFGKKLIRWERGGTEYCISAVPFGGYVAMAGEQPEDDTDGSPAEFRQKSVGVRMAIAAAGPAVNIAFSILLLFGLYLYGVQEPKSTLVVADVEKGQAADKAGVLKGDEILRLKGKPVESWEGFMQAVAVEGGNALPLTVKREGVLQDLTLTPEVDPKWGISLVGVTGEADILVGSVVPGKPAAAAGLKGGDQILAIEGTKVPSYSSLVDLINASKGQPVRMQVLRDGQETAVTVTPTLDKDQNKYVIGIYPTIQMPTEFVRRGMGESLEKSWDKNWENATILFKTLKGLFTGSIHAKALSGPVGIVQIIATSLAASVQRFLELMALISMNLGVMNLLPLAITDGGVILFLMLEAIRRKPLELKTQMRINQVAISLFLVLALYVTFQDILRIPIFLN